jgi:hypothetical protein
MNSDISLYTYNVARHINQKPPLPHVQMLQSARMLLICHPQEKRPSKGNIRT